MSNIDTICFRELNKISLNNNSMYSKEIYQYKEYYNKNKISLNKILKILLKRKNWKFIYCNGNEYDKNFWFLHNNMKIKFRTIDEKHLVDYNKNNKEIDEYVLHPDGTLTGCWDKDLKLIKKGGDHMPSRPFIPKAKKK